MLKNDFLDKYYKILSPEFPEWLSEYINTKEMQKQSKISVSCGTIYSNMYNQVWYSSLDHSIAVALIIWNFTKDKKQTLSGLFHDIATPVFKHSIDFMNGDYVVQESTEELTTKIIKNSKEIMELLKRDNIKVEEVDNYHIYPIADNDTPKLSSDRLEYTFSNGLGATDKLWDLDTVKEIYENIEIQINEENIQELGFKDRNIAEKFVHTMSNLSCQYRKAATKYSMQFLADIMKKMSSKGLISREDLYILSEEEVIKKIKECKEDDISKIFNIWKNATKIKESDEKIENKYFVNIDKVKIRYINPLVRQEENKFIRINKVSSNAQKDIENTLNYKTKKYCYLDLQMNTEGF